jgi:hypothetical protein
VLAATNLQAGADIRHGPFNFVDADGKPLRAAAIYKAMAKSASSPTSSFN